MIKASKYNQSNILDIPTIGTQTLKLLIDNDYEGVFIEKNHCLIIDQDEVTNLANTNNLFISTFEKALRENKKIFICCTEQSGRILLLIFAKDLKKYNYQIDGVVGALSEKYITNKYFDISIFKSLGLVEIIFSIPKFVKIINYLFYKLLKINMI